MNQRDKDEQSPLTQTSQNSNFQQSNASPTLEGPKQPVPIHQRSSTSVEDHKLSMKMARIEGSSGLSTNLQPYLTKKKYIKMLLQKQQQQQQKSKPDDKAHQRNRSKKSAQNVNQNHTDNKSSNNVGVVRSVSPQSWITLANQSQIMMNESTSSQPYLNHKERLISTTKIQFPTALGQHKKSNSQSSQNITGNSLIQKILDKKRNNRDNSQNQTIIHKQDDISFTTLNNYSLIQLPLQPKNSQGKLTTMKQEQKQQNSLSLSKIIPAKKIVKTIKNKPSIPNQNQQSNLFTIANELSNMLNYQPEGSKPYNQSMINLPQYNDSVNANSSISSPLQSKYQNKNNQLSVNTQQSSNQNKLMSRSLNHRSHSSHTANFKAQQQYPSTLKDFDLQSQNNQTQFLNENTDNYFYYDNDNELQQQQQLRTEGDLNDRDPYFNNYQRQTQSSIEKAKEKKQQQTLKIQEQQQNGSSQGKRRLSLFSRIKSNLNNQSNLSTNNFDAQNPQTLNHLRQQKNMQILNLSTLQSQNGSRQSQTITNQLQQDRVLLKAPYIWKYKRQKISKVDQKKEIVSNNLRRRTKQDQYSIKKLQEQMFDQRSVVEIELDQMIEKYDHKVQKQYASFVQSYENQSHVDRENLSQFISKASTKPLIQQQSDDIYQNNNQDEGQLLLNNQTELVMMNGLANDEDDDDLVPLFMKLERQQELQQQQYTRNITIQALYSNKKTLTISNEHTDQNHLHHQRSGDFIPSISTAEFQSSQNNVFHQQSNQQQQYHEDSGQNQRILANNLQESLLSNLNKPQKKNVYQHQRVDTTVSLRVNDESFSAQGTFAARKFKNENTDEEDKKSYLDESESDFQRSHRSIHLQNVESQMSKRHSVIQKVSDDEDHYTEEEKDLVFDDDLMSQSVFGGSGSNQISRSNSPDNRLLYRTPSGISQTFKIKPQYLKSYTKNFSLNKKKFPNLIGTNNEYHESNQDVQSIKSHQNQPSGTGMFPQITQNSPSIIERIKRNNLNRRFSEGIGVTSTTLHQTINQLTQNIKIRPILDQQNVRISSFSNTSSPVRERQQ
eukprot:403334155